MEYSSLPIDKQGRCFRRFCNSTEGVAHVPYITESDIILPLVKEHFDLAYHDMKEHYENISNARYNKGAYGVRFPDSVMRWACGDSDLYVDILTVAATPLLVRKPECTFFILGRQGNGKSSFRHLLQATYGNRNVSGVQISQMGSWDYASTLIGKSLNFPDEESSSIEEMDKATFKSMSTHENITIRQKGSSTPFEILCDFPSIIPLNELPNWKALDGGVARRIIILPFNADLTRETKLGGVGYEERTYTPEFISRFIGEIMGIASFYTKTGNRILWSRATNTSSNIWRQQVNNVETFAADFTRVFKGFTSTKFLYECYKCWCKGGTGNKDSGIDYQYATYKAFNEYFTIFSNWNKRQAYAPPDGGAPMLYTTQSGSDAAPLPLILSEDRTMIDVGAATGTALYTDTRDGVITAGDCVAHGWDPVTLRLLGQGLTRIDSEPEKEEYGFTR